MPRSKQEAQKRKKRVFIQKEAPLPIPIRSSGDTSGAGEWFYYTGYIQGSTVVVRHSGDMDFLYKMGFFGKGTLSRSQPNFDERRQRVNLRVPEDDHRATQTVQCAIMSKRNYLVHRRYRALAGGNGDELSDVIRYEEEQHDLAESSEESDEEYTDDENAPEEEHSIGRIQAFKLLNSHNATQGGTESERITSGDVPQLDLLDQAYMSRYIKPYLVSMLAEVSVLSNEQITSFLRVPQDLTELEDKYCMLRRAELNMLKQMYAVQFPGRNFKRGEVITLDEDENVRSQGDIENAADDAVVILDSDDESSGQETDSNGDNIAPVKKRKVSKQGDDSGEGDEKVTQKRKETDWDADDPGDEEFWGNMTSNTGESTQGQKDTKKTDCDPAINSEPAPITTDQQNSNSDGGNQQNKDKKTNNVTEEMEGIINGKADSLKSELAHTKSSGGLNVFLSQKNQLKGMEGKEQESASGTGKSEEYCDTVKEEDSKFSPGVSGYINPVFERNGRQADNEKKSLDSREDGDVEPEHSKSEQPSTEDKCWTESLSTTTKMGTSDGMSSNISSTPKLGQLSESARPASESTTTKSLSFVIGKYGEGETVKENKIESRGDNSTKSEQGLANFLQAESPTADDSNDSDDVICIESKSAEPETLHSFLSQSKKSSSGKIVVTKCVTFMSNITSEPTFVTASVGFSSWDPVVHFNFTGDPSHLPTAMSVPSLSPEHASPSAGSSDRKPAVYERVYPPIRSLIPNPNSQGAVIKQRLKGLPCLSSAYFKITAQSASSDRSYNKKQRTASIAFTSSSTPYKRQTGLNTSSSSSSSSTSSFSLTKIVSSSSHLVIPSAPSGVAPHEVSLSHLTHYLKAFHIPLSVSPSEPASLSTPTDRISPFHTPSHSNTSAKLASLSEILEALHRLYDSSTSKHRPPDGEAEVEDVGLLDTLMLNLHVTLSQYLSYAEISTAMEFELLKLILSKCDIPAGDLGDKICDMKNSLSPFHCWILCKRLDHVEERQQLLSGSCDGGADEMVVDLTDNVPRIDQEDFVEGNRSNKDDGQDESTGVTDSEGTAIITTPEAKAVEHSRDTEGDRGLFSEEVAGKKRKIEEGNEASSKKRKYVTAANQGETDSIPLDSERTFSASVNSDSNSGLKFSSDNISNGQSGHATTSSQSTGQSRLPTIVMKDEEAAQVKDSGIVDHTDLSPDSCERSSVSTSQADEGQVSQLASADNRTAHVTDDNSKESSVPQQSEGILAAQDKSNEQKLLPSSSQPQGSRLSATSAADKSGDSEDAEKSGSASIQAGCSEENQICIGSSSEDDDETTRGWNAGQYGGQTSSRRQSTAGRGKFHPYSAEDEMGGDMFVVANTSDDDAQDMDDDVDVIKKGKGQRWRPCLKTDPWPVQEKLHLMLEEAFFLSYGLGCLRVEDDEKKPLDLSQMWQHFQALNEQFIPHYVAYHYFRSQGWVPKSGLKFGCDLILYREGPPFYHGSYSVVVTTVSDSSLMPYGSPGSDLYQRELSWISLSGLNRITEHVAKELMVCYVLWPSSVSEEELRSPNCISKFTVKEVVVSRWISSQERQNKTEEEEIP